LILRALRETEGGAVAVSDAVMERETERLLRTEGLNACIEGGAVLAAARALREEERIREGDTVVLFNTGNLQNY
jgi:threonine synthase